MKYKTYRRGCNSIFALIKKNLKKRKREKRRVEEFLLTIVEMKVEEDRIFLSIYLIIFFFSSMFVTEENGKIEDEKGR